MTAKLTLIPGGVVADWLDEHVRITATHWQNGKSGVVAEIEAELTVPGMPPYVHGPVRLNLTSSRDQSSLRKTLEERCPKTAQELPLPIDWTYIVAAFCKLGLQWHREGRPAVTITGSKNAKPPEWLLEPFIIKRNPVLLFGDGGTAKSSIGQLAAMALALPWGDNPMRWMPPNRCIQTLYCDWESNEEIMDWRMLKLRIGHGFPEMPFLHHVTCSAPFASEIEHIARKITHYKAEVIIIDSATGACGGDINKPEITSPFFDSLRSLDIASLIIHHVSKEGQKTRDSTPVGSYQFWTRPRLLWRSRKISEERHDNIYTLVVGLKDIKHNDLPPHRPFGLRFEFSPDTTKVSYEATADSPELEEDEPLYIRILHTLRHGSQTTADIAKEISAPEAQVRARLNEMRKRKQVVSLERGLWGLITEDEDED